MSRTWSMSRDGNTPEMDDVVTCTLCGQVAEVDRWPWEVTWATDCASSVHKLVRLRDRSFFAEAAYCSPCKELVRDIHFMTNSVAVLKHRLDMAKGMVTQMLKMDMAKAKVTQTDMDQEYEAEVTESEESGDDGSDADFEDDFGIRCTVTGCGKCFVGKSELNQHLIKVHSADKRAYRARLMEKRKDKGSPSVADEKVFYCSEKGCGGIFERSTHLARHLKNVHSTDDATWRPRHAGDKVGAAAYDEECTVEGCGKRFGRKSHLTRHLKYVHASNRSPKPTFSDKFKEKFGSDPTVIQDEGVFDCSEEGCGKIFARKAHLTRHMAQVHLVGDELDPEHDPEPVRLKRKRNFRRRAT